MQPNFYVRLAESMGACEALTLLLDVLQGEGGGMNPQAAQQQEERRRAMEEQKDSMLSQILTQDARERCA
jgi:hypothetical protein